MICKKTGTFSASTQPSTVHLFIYSGIQEDVVTLAGPCLLVGVITAATVGCAVTFHQVSLLTTGLTPAHLLTQRAVGGAG